MMGFLLKNGVAFDPEPAQSTSIILALAAGEVSEESLTRWIRDNWPHAGPQVARKCSWCTGSPLPLLSRMDCGNSTARREP